MLDPLLAIFTWAFITKTTVTINEIQTTQTRAEDNQGVQQKIGYEIQETGPIQQQTGQVEERRVDNQLDEMGKTTTGQNETIKGYVSHYSADWGSCLGCNPHYDEKGQLYYVTASGDRLDNSKYTIACNHFPIGTRVSLRNLSNNKSVGAVINDTGGFNSLNRIADLMPLVAQALDSKTGGNGFEGDLIEIKTLEKQE